MIRLILEGRFNSVLLINYSGSFLGLKEGDRCGAGGRRTGHGIRGILLAADTAS